MAGFMVGWTYWLTWIISGMAEVTAVAKYVDFWYPDMPNWITAAATILVLVALNLFSAKLFGELEFWLLSIMCYYNFSFNYCWYCNGNLCYEDGLRSRL